MDVFRKMIGDHECFSMDVNNRMRDIKNCVNIKDLQDTLKREDLQKTVEKAIKSRIRKLSRENECRTSQK